MHVRAAAQLARVVADLDDPDDVAVPLAEEPDGAEGLGLVHRRLEDLHGFVGADPAVRLELHFLEQTRSDRRRMREVEPEPPRLHERSRLSGVIAEEPLQRPMDDVRRRVGAAIDVDRRVRDLVGPHLARLDDADVHDRVLARRDRVLDTDHARRRADRASIADLSTTLGVEGRAFQEDPDPFALLRRRELFVRLVQQQRQRRLRLGLAVADELGRRDGAGPETDLDLLRAAARALALLLEELAEPVRVHGHPLLGRDLLDELDRVPERVVQAERVVATDPAALGTAARLVELHRALAERRREPLLLGVGDLPDEGLVLAELGMTASSTPPSTPNRRACETTRRSIRRRM